MKITEWFDIKNPKHLSAYEYLINFGTWPKDFLPADIEFPPNWFNILQSKFVDEFFVNLRERKLMLTSLAYSVEVHCATLGYYKSKKSTPKSELERYEEIVSIGIQLLKSYGYNSKMAMESRRTPRVMDLLKESEKLEKLV